MQASAPLLLLLLVCQPLAAQTSAPAARSFTVQEAVDYALQNYPAVRAALERYNAARAGVSLARTAYLPRLDALYQGDRGTRNSVLGVLLPQSPTVLSSTQGSVRQASDRTFWVSGVGALFTWEPFDFGFRNSKVRSAEATRSRTAAEISLTRLGVAAAVTDASLAVLADAQRVKASQADVDRRTVFARSVHALVDAHLRPGADASRAEAELAAARTQLILSEQTFDVARAALAELLGMPGGQVDVRTGPFLTAPPAHPWAQAAVTSHPAAVAEQRRVQEAQARINVLTHTYYPHFTLEGLLSGRGSGENPDGTSNSGFNGLDPTAVHNWEAGLTVWLPLLDLPAIRQQQNVEISNRDHEEALFKLTLDTIGGQIAREQATLAAARRVAANTPIELQASRDSEAQARARFRAGVGNIVDVAEAQRLLVGAEIDDSLARLRIWRALADLAAAQGDVAPFLHLASSVPNGAR